MEKYLDVYRRGITVENFPVVMAHVYRDIKLVTTSRAAAEKKCMETLVHIIDNTDSGEHDKELDAIMKRMLPGLIDAFFDLLDAKTSCLCFKK